MCAEPAAAIAKVSAGLRYSPRRDTEWLRFRCDVEHSHHLPILQAFIGCRFADHHYKIPPRLSSIGCGTVVIMIDTGGSGGPGSQSLFCKLAKLHGQQRESRMRAHVRW